MQHNKIFLRNGFTLIEVMIVVAIIAILSSVAVPSYMESVRRGNRAEAVATMLQAANWMEQQFTVNNTYIGATTDTLKTAGFGASPKSGTAKYNLTLTAAKTTITGYELVATQVGTADKCGNFTLDQSGKRTVNGTATAADCWGGR